MSQAKAILVFPSMTKAGFLVGTQAGEGALFRRGKAVAHYSAGGASLGRQAGAQSYTYSSSRRFPGSGNRGPRIA